MVYQFCEGLKDKSIGRFKVILFIQYVVAAGVFLYIIIDLFSELKFIYKLPFIILIIGLFPLWRFFVDRFELEMNKQWVVSDTYLKIVVNDIEKFKVDLSHIGTITEIKNGHIVNHRGNSFFIPNGIKDKVKLIEELSKNKKAKN